jgi:hypothetical protein
MSRNLQSQTKLTEFAPLSPEVENGSGFGYIFSRFFRRRTFEPNLFLCGFFLTTYVCICTSCFIKFLPFSENSPEEVKTSDSSEVSISSSDPQWQEPDYKVSWYFIFPILFLNTGTSLNTTLKSVW